MFFERFIRDLPGEPSFQRFEKRDVNPVSRRVKYRALFAPNEAMLVLQERFLAYLRSFRLREARKEALRFATSFRPGCSSMGNVKPHRGNRYFFLLDLKDAFPSVNCRKLALILAGLDREQFGDGESSPHIEELERFLGTYFFTPDEGLATGGPAANDLFNLYAGVLIDRNLEDFVSSSGCTYTRYVDDLTFSSNAEIEKPQRLAIRGVIESAGFTVNDWKSQICDLEKTPVVITGIGLKLDGSVFLPRGYTRHLFGFIHRARVAGDVNPHEVHGKMGVFFSITGRDPLQMNKIEQRLVREYELFRRKR